jgi:hypothetical protein
LNESALKLIPLSKEIPITDRVRYGESDDPGSWLMPANVANFHFRQGFLKAVSIALDSTPDRGKLTAPRPLAGCCAERGHPIDLTDIVI